MENKNGYIEYFIFRTKIKRVTLKEIRNIISTYEAADHTSEKLALASVVNVEESSYRRIGARMLVSSNGQWIGGISGGCLEGDALKRSQQAIFKNKSSRVIYDTMDDDQNQIGVGLGCNGRIEVLFTPIDPTDKNNPIEQLRRIVASDAPSILLKIIEVGDSQELLGQTQITKEDLSDLNFHDLDRSKLNNAITETLRKQRPQVLNFQHQSGEQLKVLIEFLRPETKLVIVGHNYDVNAFAGIAHELGWEMHIIGAVKKFSKNIFSKAKQVYQYEDFVKVPIDEFTAVVLMSHDYNWDKKILPHFLAQNPPYIGMLGPKKRMQKMKDELQLQNLDEVNYFYSPVGLDIGAETPEEIALSIASEIVAVFRKRKGGYLKHRKGTIHLRE